MRYLKGHNHLTDIGHRYQETGDSQPSYPDDLRNVQSNLVECEGMTNSSSVGLRGDCNHPEEAQYQCELRLRTLESIHCFMIVMLSVSDGDVEGYS